MKKLLFSLALGLATLASTLAQTVEITLTGATAFRVNAYNSIRAMYNPGFSQNPAHAAGTELQNRVTWSGTMPAFGARTVVVKAGYSGSTAGIASVANNTTVTFLSSATPGNATTVNQTADFTFSDVFQSSSATPSPVLEDYFAGVIPFVWVRGKTCSPKVTSITDQNARGVFAAGFFPLFVLSGDPVDLGSSEIVNVAGRNSGSGTRAAVLSEIGLGPLAVINQRKTNAVSGQWETDTIGFASNSLIPAHLNSGANNSPEGPGGAIGYLDVNDAETVRAGGGAILAYNGVNLFISPGNYNFDAVRTGKYPLWTYEHLMHRSGIAADETTFRDAFLSEIDAELATSISAIQTSTMVVSRLDDGATITP